MDGNCQLPKKNLVFPALELKETQVPSNLEEKREKGRKIVVQLGIMGGGGTFVR